MLFQLDAHCKCILTLESQWVQPVSPHCGELVHLTLWSDWERFTPEESSTLSTPPSCLCLSVLSSSPSALLCFSCETTPLFLTHSFDCLASHLLHHLYFYPWYVIILVTYYPAPKMYIKSLFFLIWPLICSHPLYQHTIIGSDPPARRHTAHLDLSTGVIGLDWINCSSPPVWLTARDRQLRDSRWLI